MKNNNTAQTTKRVIVDYTKLNQNILNLLVEKYPDGYDDKDIICFRNLAGEWIECVEVNTDDTVYLVKVSKRLKTAMDNFDNEDGIYEQDDDFMDMESNKSVSEFED